MKHKRIYLILALFFSAAFCTEFMLYAQEATPKTETKKVRRVANATERAAILLNRIRLKKVFFDNIKPLQAVEYLNVQIKKSGYQLVLDMTVQESREREIYFSAEQITAYDTLRLLCAVGKMQISISGNKITLTARKDNDIDLSPNSDLNVMRRLQDITVDTAKFTGTMPEFCQYHCLSGQSM